MASVTAPALPAPFDAPAPRGRHALRHPVQWAKAHPTAADAALAAVVLALPLAIWAAGPATPDGATFRDPDAGLVVALLLTSIPLAWRRRRPLLVLGLTFLAALVVGARSYNTTILLAGDLVALYTVGAHCARRASRRVIIAAAVILGPLMYLTRVQDMGDPLTWGEIFASYVFYGLVWLVGDNLQTRRANVAALQERAVRAERDRVEDARRAVEAERSRIAREMHDVVAHSMSVMVVQATGAQRVIARDPTQAAEALRLIESTGRQALTEMRRLLGVLRDDGPTLADGRDEARAPQPSLDRLDDLADQCESAGLAVAIRRRGEAVRLPPGVDLAAYRIVQEALTNVRRHAGPATAGVTITYGDDEVEIEVADNGRGVGAGGGIGVTGGHGLVGMRERAALYGGSVHAGPRAGGGFAVRALLPLAPP